MEILLTTVVVAVLHLYYLILRRNHLLKEGVRNVKKAIRLLDELQDDITTETIATNNRLRKIKKRHHILVESLGMSYEPGTSETKTTITPSKYVKATKTKKAVRKSK